MSTIPLAATLHAQAAELRDAASAGPLPQPLRGRNVALLTTDAAAPQAAAIAHAARQLGAQVVHVRPDTLPPAGPGRAHTLTMLGRLYDAVIAEGVAPDLVTQVAAFADRPVLTTDRVPPADRFDDWVLQAWLIDAMA